MVSKYNIAYHSLKNWSNWPIREVRLNLSSLFPVRDEFKNEIFVRFVSFNFVYFYSTQQA